MKKRAKYILIAFSLAVLLSGTVVSLVFWAWNSPEGTRLLLKAVSFLSPVRIEAEEIQGRLRDELDLRGVKIRWTRGEIQADRLHLRWQPAELWNRWLILNEVYLSAVVFHDRGPGAKKPFFPGWPQAPFWLTKIQGRIDSFRLHDFVYREPNQDPFRLGQMIARGEWDGKALTIQDCALRGPWGSAEGSLKMGFANPSLNLALEIVLAGDYAGLDRLSMMLRLEPANVPDEAAGTIRISGQNQNTERLSLESDLGLTPAALSWKNLLCRQPGRKGTLRSEGSWSFGVRPSLQGRFIVSETDLSSELGFPTDLFADLEISGSLEDYRGKILLANKAKGWPEANISGEIRGNLQGVKISNLNASWLDGRVEGLLAFSWAEGAMLEGKLQGKKLNPAKLDPEWAGELNLKIEGKAALKENRISEALVKADFSESRLRGWLFSGDLKGGLEKDLWKISQLHLRTEGLALRAQGIVQERVNVEARITDLSRLIPQAWGEISTAGWFRFRQNRLSGTLRGQGKDLTLNDIRAGALAAEFRLDESAPNSQPTFSLQSRLLDIKAGSFTGQSLNLETSGSLKRHEARVTFHFDGGEVQGELNGEYEKNAWKGTIGKLTAKEAKGFWNLQAPARIQWSFGKFLITPLALKSGRGERIQIEANLGLDPLAGDILAEWENLDLDRANPWLGAGKLSGHSTGALSAKAQKGGMKISGTSSLSGTFVQDQIKVEVVSGKARGDWSEKGLLASFALQFRQGGTLEADISSQEGVQAAFPQTGKIEAKWRGIDHDLFSPGFPSGLSLQGQSSGQAAGQWFPGFRFEAAGAVKVSRTDVAWQREEKPIAVALQKADLEFSWREDSLQGDISLALADHGIVQGRFELPLAARIPPSFRSEGSLKIALSGLLQEKGFLAGLYPETIRKSRGNLELDFLAGGTWNRPKFKGTAQLAETAIEFFPGEENRKIGNGPDLFNLEVSTGSAAMEWADEGLRASLTLGFTNHGQLEGKIVSSEPAHFSFPKKGQAELTWSGLDTALLRPFGPKELLLEGSLAGQIKGNWLPEFHLEATGEIKLTKGKLGWRTENGLISAKINQGDADFTWKGENLQGNLSFTLETYGALQGKVRLPIPARFPPRIDRAGKVQAAFRGQARENGLLAAFLPGTVQESRGNIDLDFQVNGTWEAPTPKGAARLAEAGAFLPGLGIRVEGLSAKFQWQGDQVRIESFEARSGPGRVEGSGILWLKNWRVERYEGKIQGDKFQVLYLPDLRVQTSPQLVIQGNSRHLSVRGEVLLPDVLVQPTGSPGMVQPSSDVIIIDQPPAKPASYSLDMQVRMILGDKVLVKAGGIEARLGGNLDLNAEGVQSSQMTARGEIRVREGSYNGYGLNLRIDRGRLLFPGGPVDNPALDILALRREDDLERLSNIKVGVVILGNLQRPVVKLYSIPAMKDEDILSYLLSGRPYDRQSANLSLLMVGAGALLSGDSPGPVDKLRSLMGIDKVDIESQSGDLSRSMVTLGKYLTPKLYLSYGYSLFDNGQVLKVRYKISKSWEVEAQRGTGTAVDLYYRIDFF